MSNLEGINYWADWCLEDIVLYNVINFVKYGLLEIGAYINIQKDQVNYLGHDLSRLNPVVGVTGITDYTIYKGPRPDWVWETGIAIKPTGVTAPYVPSGIYINNAFHPTGVIASGNSYSMDFSRGQIVFNSGRAPTDVVQVPHSVRLVQVYQTESQEYADLVSNWNQAAGTGHITGLKPKAYLPAIFIDIPSMTTVRGVQQGSRAKVSDIAVEFLAVSATPSEVRKLSSSLYFLETKSFNIYNITSETFALNAYGELVYPNRTWPILASGALYQGRFEENAKTSRARMEPPLFARRLICSLRIDTFPA